MTNTYRALSPAAEAAYESGVFEREFSPSEEADVLASGLVEIVPRKYKVLSNNYAAGKQGDVVTLALLVDHEAALVSGGHLKRVDEPEPKPRGKRGSPQKEED
jgi:hypothetical protein